MVRPRSEQVVPRLIQPDAVSAVHHVLGEERVAALVLHLQHEGIVLGTVVRVVERLRHRVLVRGIGLAVRVRGQERHVFGHVGAKRLVAGALGVADDDALQGVAGRAFRLRGEHHAHDGVPVLAKLGIRLELHDVATGRHVDREGHGARGRKVIGPDRRSVGTRAEGQRRRDVRRQDRAQGLGGENRPSRPASRGGGLRGRRHRASGSSPGRAAPGAGHRANHDARVAPDDDRRRARAGRDIGEEQIDLLGTRRGRSAAAAAATIPDSKREVVSRFGLQRRIVERQRALVAGAAGGQVAAGKKPARPGSQVLLNLVAASAPLRQGRLEVGCRRRKFRPAIHRLARRISGVRLVDRRPDVVGKATGDAFFRRKPANRRGGIAERNAVLVVPRDIEGLAVPFEPERPAPFARDHAKALRIVKGVDPVERRQLEPRPAGIGIELERSRTDDRVIGDELRGLEISLDTLILHELDIAEVREALAADRVARGIDADLDVDARQVANRIGVLGAGQAPDGHAPGLARVRGLVRLHGRTDPRGRRLALVVGRLLGRLELAASGRSPASRRLFPNSQNAR